MKKSLLFLFAALMIFQCNLTYAETTETTGLFTAIKNAIIKDVTNTAQSTVNAAAKKAMNMVKIAEYKQEIKQKKQELADLEASNRNFIVKFFQRRKINREINKLESQIKALEG